MKQDAVIANPGWYADPTGRHEYRYWDGNGWSESVSDRGVTARDEAVLPPPSAPPAAPRSVGPATPAAAEPLRDVQLCHRGVVVGRRIAVAAAALLLVLGTLQVIFAYTMTLENGNTRGAVHWGVGPTINATTVLAPDDTIDHGPVSWASRGFNPPADLDREAYAMGPLFLVLLVAWLVLSATSWPSRLQRASSSRRRVYRFKARSVTARLGIMTALSASMVLLYVVTTSSLVNDGYDIDGGGWVGLVLVITLLVADVITLVVPRKHARVDRLGNLSTDGDTATS